LVHIKRADKQFCDSLNGIYGNHRPEYKHMSD